jgi:hypothetical protein
VPARRFEPAAGVRGGRRYRNAAPLAARPIEQQRLFAATGMMRRRCDRAHRQAEPLFNRNPIELALVTAGMALILWAIYLNVRLLTG